MTLDEVLRRIYRCECNISITTFWDGGYELKLGDHINGFVAEGNTDTALEAAAWFDARAREHLKGYPAKDAK